MNSGGQAPFDPDYLSLPFTGSPSFNYLNVGIYKVEAYICDSERKSLDGCSPSVTPSPYLAPHFLLPVFITTWFPSVTSNLKHLKQDSFIRPSTFPCHCFLSTSILSLE
jgi:hypothetical protein